MVIGKFPNLTPSRAAALACRKRFLEEHVLKIAPQEEFSQSLTFGIGVHAVLKRLTDPSLPKPAGERNIETEVRRAFLGQTYPDAKLREVDIVRAVQTVTNYLAQDTETASILGVEVFAEFTLDSSGPRRLAFGAKFDALIARRQSGVTLVVRDYKTGKPRQIDMESACIALAVAKAKLNQFRRDYDLLFTDVLLEFDYIAETGLTDRVTLGVQDVKSVWPDLKARAQRVYSSDEFPAEPGEHCLLCPLRKTCRPSQTLAMNELDAIFA